MAAVTLAVEVTGERRIFSVDETEALGALGRGVKSWSVNAQLKELNVKHTITLLAALLLALPAALRADDSSKSDTAALSRARTEAAKTFKNEVSPFISNYCLRCHNDKRPSGDVTFQNVAKTPDGLAFKHLWKRASTQI